MKTADADRLLAFVRTGAAPARLVAGGARTEDPSRRADQIATHWRNEVAVLTAAPGIAGRLSDVVVDIIGATAQGLLVLSLCELADLDDEQDRVRLVARHVLGEKLPRGWSPAKAAVPEEPEVEDDPAWRRVLSAAPGALVTSLKTMWAVRKLTGKRAEGRFWHRGLANIPVVGVAGRVLGERHAMTGLARDVAHELGLAGPVTS